jgi:4-hydroxy-tetrahydrodipicolinate synthase
MATPERLSGLLTPAVTPFREDLSPDRDRWLQHCRWLMSQNSGLAVFGTNSEANSLSLNEKMDLLDFLVDSGIDTTRLMPGTGLCALTETVKLTSHAVDLGCAGTLMLPPFFYKDVSDEGLFASFAEVIEGVGNERLRIYLYHIPPVSHVGISPELVERLVTRYPDIVVGIKDSSGDWNNTEALHALGLDDFRIFAGSEAFLLQNMKRGGAGCISAASNVNAGAIHRLYADWQSDDAEVRQQELNQIRSALEQYPMIAAMKATIGGFRNDPQWRSVRPPLTPLSSDQADDLLEKLHELNFRMPDLIS